MVVCWSSLRSIMQLINFWKHLAKRNSKLKRLRLVNCNKVTDNGLMEACKSFPLLEELEIAYCYGVELPFESVGHSCPNLKIFRLASSGPRSLITCNEAALAIAKNLCGLRELQLFENRLNEEGMHAILDGCPFLDSLDVRWCFQLDFGDDLKDRCKGFTSLRVPRDSLLNYPNALDAYFHKLPPVRRISW